MAKEPGLDRDGVRLREVPLNLSLDAEFAGTRRRIAYERLLLDLIEGDQTLFVRRDEVEAQWTWTDASGEHTVKNWRSPEDAFRYAPFATMTVGAVAEHFTGGSHGTNGAPSA